MTTRNRRPKKDAIDKEIEAVFYRVADRVQIPILSITRIYAAGRAAAATGGSIEAAVTATVAAVRLN